MIQITKDEAAYLRTKKMDYFIHISSATHSSRAKRYYLTEDKRVMRLLQNYRNDAAVFTYNQNNPRVTN